VDFGTDSSGIWAVLARTTLVFVILLVFIRLSSRRFLARYSAFDAVLAIVVGSVASRGINGSAPFWPTMAATGLLLVLHRSCAELAYRSRRVRKLLSGDPIELVTDGTMRRDGMHRAQISEEDLLEALRYEGNTAERERVASARLECNGRVSVVRKETEGAA